MILPWFWCSHIHAGEMQTCYLTILVFLPQIDLCFLSACSEVAKVFLLLFSKEEFKQLKGVCWSDHLSPLCPVGLAICPIAMALRGQA